MRVVFRSDASLAIGTGHVMRCLTLAHELARRGHDCHFVCGDVPGNLNAQVGATFSVTVLPASDGSEQDGPMPASAPAHSLWAEMGWMQDAAETRAALGDADWLVLDHYSFDARWQAAARTGATRMMVIDDLADRAHACDFLLDQNLGRTAADYDAHVPAGAERLIGPRHALLRPEFFATRAPALERRGGPLRHLLIALGGVDAGNAAGAALHILSELPLPERFRVTVALGPTAPHLAALRALSLPFPCEVRAGVPDMAALMRDADLCLGAAGGSAWERCALGLPTLLLVLAENQQAGAKALADAGVAHWLGAPDAGLAQRLADALRKFTAPDALASMAAAAARVTDGRGAARVADALEHPLALRPATMADAETVWRWRADLPPSHFRAGNAPPPLADHLAWWAAALATPWRQLLMAPGAHLRLDIVDYSAAVSILLEPEARGRGHGLRLLYLLHEHARRTGLRILTAEAATDNAASCALFRAAGYREVAREGRFARFNLTLAPSRQEDP